MSWSWTCSLIQLCRKSPQPWNASSESHSSGHNSQSFFGATGPRTQRFWFRSELGGAVPGLLGLCSLGVSPAQAVVTWCTDSTLCTCGWEGAVADGVFRKRCRKSHQKASGTPYCLLVVGKASQVWWQTVKFLQTHCKRVSVWSSRSTHAFCLPLGWCTALSGLSQAFKSFSAGLRPQLRQVPDPEALLSVSRLTNPPGRTWTSKFGQSQITSPVLPRGTREVKRRDVSAVTGGHWVYLTGDPLAGKERGKSRPFCLQEDKPSIHFTRLSSEGRRGKGERNKAGN